ncbi:unnamed protein product [Eruca vesicaria subsp. sativa]|uniref:Uncharacterized protein n=1 Tax=Eruca vesicaria subsp. sativa TaxID=29727 RepID=A0ABC8JEI2_ERUVS|nr:unnamed protein product [Eruca vesicaria subsp. sativa]
MASQGFSAKLTNRFLKTIKYCVLFDIKEKTLKKLFKQQEVYRKSNSIILSTKGRLNKLKTLAIVSK